MFEQNDKTNDASKITLDQRIIPKNIKLPGLVVGFVKFGLMYESKM